jgi:hypothetical protein
MRIRAIVSLLAALAIAAPVFAQDREPLVVIRFNQQRVYYDQQLYNAIAKAVAIKPDLMIDLVSYAPQTSNGEANIAWQRAAGDHAQRVVASLVQMGVPQSRISVTGQQVAGITSDETHVFVR